MSTRITVKALTACAATLLALLVTQGVRGADAPEGRIGLSPAEKEWLRAHPVVTLSLDEVNPPLNYRRADAEGRPSFAGANVDYMNLIASKAGFSLRFEGSTWAVALDKAMQHQVDGVPGARMLEERKRRLNFTEPYLEIPIAMVTRSG